ncbi:MAG: DUF4159 domain-containing protein [Luteolibacter sp.]
MKHLLFLLIATFTQAAPTVDWNSETIHCGNLVYGKGQTSVCFADAFLKETAKQTGLNIAPKFVRINIAKPELFNTPICIFTGEGDFTLQGSERANLKKYLENGGFILASPGCSNSAWNKAFRRETSLALPGYEMKQIPMTHELFDTVHKIRTITVKGKTTHLQGIFINGRLAMVYSPEGLNDASNAKGCCCCGGAEIKDAKNININALAYALLH